MVVACYGLDCGTNLSGIAAKLASGPLHKPALETGLILNSDELEMFAYKSFLQGKQIKDQEFH